MTMANITAQEAAKILGCAASSVTRLCQEQRLKAQKLRDGGGQYRWAIDRDSVECFKRIRVRYGKRSPVRLLVDRLMSDGTPRSLAEVARSLKVSKDLARVYLKELGYTRDPATNKWGKHVQGVE